MDYSKLSPAILQFLVEGLRDEVAELEQENARLRLELLKGSGKPDFASAFLREEVQFQGFMRRTLEGVCLIFSEGQS